ncbi:MAG: hypothetical protein B7Z73_09255 [Planctomycetia bacterium 21-64-5]|nr:MAG: hypothetical protein B7Z73_09255 [Planctomycetia bacterium 21-64-5]
MDTYDPGPPGVSDQSVWGTHDQSISGTVYAYGGTGSYTFSVDAGPSSGTVSMDQSGNFTYTPDYHFYGTDSFTYTATDANDGETSTPATVSITVQETAPTAANYTYTILHDQIFAVGAPGVLQDSTDAEGDQLTASLASGPSSAKDFELNPDGSWAYLPDDGFLGDDSFTYNVTDGILTTTGTVTIHVVDQKPVAEDDQYFFSAQQTNVSISADAGVQANDTDPDGDMLKSYIVTEPSSGSLTLNTDGSFSYTVAGDVIANGASITFTYKDSDGAMYSDDKTVTMYFIHVHITNPVLEVGAITQPADANGDGNEFTFDASNPGVLTLPVKATVAPDVQAVRDNVYLYASADPIGDSGESDPGFTYSATNGYWLDNITYTGLPSNSSDFGTKQVTVSAFPGDSDSEQYQVFFNRNATNHPGGDDTPPNVASARSPNWFHYWIQAVASSDNVYYNSNEQNYGEAPAMLQWSNPLNYGKTDVWIGSAASGSDTRRDGSNQVVTGIDLFANVLAHEHVHIEQIADADALLGSLNGQPGNWLAGWSWNTTPNNHTIPDGMGGMTNLDTNNNDIPDSWEPYDIEGAAGDAETIPENTYWQSDWADPGKQHAQDQVDTD